MRRTPDWVVEGLSPTTAGHHLMKKRRIYERHEVKEYWLVHPTDRVLAVYRLAGEEYGKPDVRNLWGGDAARGVCRRRDRLGRARGRLPEADPRSRPPWALDELLLPSGSLGQDRSQAVLALRSSLGARSPP